MRLTVDLSPEQAAGLRRFAEKVSHEMAVSVLYGHVMSDIRINQISQILAAFGALEVALSDADVSSWPWIETGQVL